MSFDVGDQVHSEGVCEDHKRSKKGCCVVCKCCKKCNPPRICSRLDLHLTSNKRGPRKFQNQTPPSLGLYSTSSLHSPFETVLQTPPTVKLVTRSSSSSFHTPFETTPQTSPISELENRSSLSPNRRDNIEPQELFSSVQKRRP